MGTQGTQEHARGTLYRFTFTFSHFGDAFIQSDLQLGNTWSDSPWGGNKTEEVLVTIIIRHCSNKYKLAREGINKKKGPWRGRQFRVPWRSRQFTGPWQSWQFRVPWWSRQFKGPWRSRQFWVPWRSRQFWVPWQSRQFWVPWRSRQLKGPWQSRQFKGTWRIFLGRTPGPLASTGTVLG